MKKEEENQVNAVPWKPRESVSKREEASATVSDAPDRSSKLRDEKESKDLTIRSLLITLRGTFFSQKFYLRERVHTNWREREGETESKADYRLSIEPDVVLNPTTARSLPKLKPRVGCPTG